MGVEEKNFRVVPHPGKDPDDRVGPRCREDGPFTKEGALLHCIRHDDHPTPHRCFTGVDASNANDPTAWTWYEWD